MERTQLLTQIVALDAKLMEVIARAAQTTDDIEFEGVITDVRYMRAVRAELQAKLDALG